MDESTKYLIFPIEASDGFEVDSEEKYWYLMQCIGEATLQLIEEYPDKICWVTWELGNGD